MELVHSPAKLTPVFIALKSWVSTSFLDKLAGSERASCSIQLMEADAKLEFLLQRSGKDPAVSDSHQRSDP